ncbi:MULTISPECIES: hypothetical protein [unclassified Xanthomonas]|uniref:hypothetical protein n=1 Tax=Xanthomonas sp. LMG 9002 TaxID=1591158 RepID=UPI0013694FCD|nr:hypothetical protein [Xanthomonas sp. LMG 9002]MXV05651.1 hypothetical protein [Xanthomonas sp. LMG 9002]
MTDKTKDTVLLQITEVLGPLLERQGFVRRRHRFEAVDGDGNVRGYELCLSRSKGHFALHLRLALANPALMERVNAALKQALLDADAAHPANWDAATIGKAIETRTRDTTLAMLTDWRCFKAADESLEAFRERFSIWLCVFDALEDVHDWRVQVVQSVAFAQDWCSRVGSGQWVIDSTSYPALFLLNAQGRHAELQHKYEEVLSRSRAKNEVALFFRHLAMS